MSGPQNSLYNVQLVEKFRPSLDTETLLLILELPVRLIKAVWPVTPIKQ